MDFEKYYTEQSGGGAYSGPLWQEGGAIRGFAGREFQQGHGLASFGRTLFRWARPLLKYLGKEGLKTGVNIGTDVMAGSNIKDAAIGRARESGAKIVDDAAAVIKRKLTGKGMARRRRRRAPKARKTHKRPAIRRRRTVRRKSTRKRVKAALKDIFT